MQASSGERALGGGDRIGVAGIDREGSAQHARYRLEAGLGDVVVVLAIEVDDVQRQPGVLGERLKELLEELGVEIADFRPRERDLPDEVGPAGDIHGRARTSLVHGEVDRGVARDALAVAERLADRLAERDADVFRRVVEVDMRVALGAHGQVDQRMARELLQHMVEEADPGRHVVAAGAVEIDGDGDFRLGGVAGDFRCAHGAVPVPDAG